MLGILAFNWLTAAAGAVYSVTSPDGHLTATARVGRTVTFSVSRDGRELLSPSPVSMTLGDGTVLGRDCKVKDVSRADHEGAFTATFYTKDKVDDNYRALNVVFAERFNIEIRAYNEGVAYRFVTDFKDSITVMDEQAEFGFPKNWPVRIAYSNMEGSAERQFGGSYENLYTVTTFSGLNSQRLIMLPLLVEADEGVKVLLAESDVEDYPGMYIRTGLGQAWLRGTLAQYPSAVRHGGPMGGAEKAVTARHDYLVKTTGRRAFPWRIVAVSTSDEGLLSNDMVYRLASPCRLDDISWIRPGKVAWEWWNVFGLHGVDFIAGRNNQTYKAYIDFASRYNLEYVILDGGWSKGGNLLKTVDAINLDELISYAHSKGVELILWAGFNDIDGHLDEVFKFYSAKGIKGFKIDFIDRDDAAAVRFVYEASRLAAQYHLVLDFHGMYKPTGLSRTYPNVLNYEAIDGQEQVKWSDMKRYDQVPYDVTFPFIRLVAGPVDYTQGAMRNATRATFGTSNTEPMSQGTRCRQLAEYVVFFSPLNMLCDSPSNYEDNIECTKFISGVPTTWDETRPLRSKVGEYVAVARRKGDVWYVGALTDWTARDLTLDLSFLGSGKWHGEAFYDGVNADRFAQDYVRQSVTLPSDGQLRVHLAPGGGCVLQLTK